MLYDEITEREALLAGWSDDKKYTAHLRDGRRVLLRVSDAALCARKQLQFEMMKKAWRSGVRMCEPLETGISHEGAYILLTYVEGVNAEEALNTMSEDEKRSKGCAAGRELHALHALPIPQQAETWESRFGRKMERKLETYAQCPLKHPKGELLAELVRADGALIKGRAQGYQHGDFHIGNMLLAPSGDIVIIDFDRDDFGDPYEEFNRIVWSAQFSAAFASGIIDGYFEGSVPADFWRLLRLYTACNSLSCLAWAARFGEGEIEVMLRQIDFVIASYDDMRREIPSWYSSGCT